MANVFDAAMPSSLGSWCDLRCNRIGCCVMARIPGSSGNSNLSFSDCLSAQWSRMPSQSGPLHIAGAVINLAILKRARAYMNRDDGVFMLSYSVRPLDKLYMELAAARTREQKIRINTLGS